MDDKPTHDELAAHVERLREAMSLVIRKLGGHLTLENALEQTPAQSLHHIKAQVEEETIERCSVESWNHFMKACTYRKVSHGDYDDFCSTGSVRNTVRKYSNQLETAVKDGE